MIMVFNVNSYCQLSKKCQRKSVSIFLSINLNMCFRCLKEPSHWDGSFEYPQQMLWLRNKKIIFCYALLSVGPVISMLTTGYFFFFLEQMRKLEESEKARREAEEAAEAARREMEDRDNGTLFNSLHFWIPQ